MRLEQLSRRQPLPPPPEYGAMDVCKQPQVSMHGLISTCVCRYYSAIAAAIIYLMTGLPKQRGNLLYCLLLCHGVTTRLYTPMMHQMSMSSGSAVQCKAV